MANSTQGRQDHLFILGSSNFELQSTTPSSHAAHSAGRLDHHIRGRTGVSESPRQDPFEMYFDYLKYNDGETDATTQSDLFSEGSPETSPSTVTTGSSVGTGPDLEDVEMTDASPSPLPLLPHNEHLFPKDYNPYIPRHPVIHDNDDLTPHTAEATTTPVTAPRRNQVRKPSRTPASPATDSRGRTRKVNEPQKTSRVRENGACTLCRGMRVSCSADGVCDKCSKLCEGSGVDAAEVCIRRVLYDSVSGSINRWCQDDRIPHPQDKPLQPNSITVVISFSEAPQSPRLYLQAMRHPGGLFIIQENGLAHHDAISNWTRDQLRVGASQDFDSLLQQLLVVFVEHRALDYADNPVSRSASDFVTAQKGWMENLLAMRAMWNVWNWRKFHICGVRGQPLTESTQPIYEYLREYAAQETARLEKVVLEKIDKLQGGMKFGDDSTSQLFTVYHVGVWISLWQLALIYRNSLRAPLSFRKEHFRKTTEDLYKKVVVLYSVIFRTSKALRCLTSAESGVFSGRPVVGDAFQKAWQSHRDFYDSFRQQYSGDKLTQKLVMAKEAKVLGRKQSRK